MSLLAVQSLALVSSRAAPRMMAFYPVNEAKQPLPVTNALKKRSGALTVSVEYIPCNDDVACIDAGEIAGAGRRTIALDPAERLSRLSAALRGGREAGGDAAAIWTSDLQAVRAFSKEQSTAKGDFPGPCPVVFNGDSAHADTAIADGAAAVVLRAEELETAKALQGVEVIWRVESQSDIETIVADEAAPENCFLVDGPHAASLVEVLPAGAIAVAELMAMQDDDAEITVGRELAAAGCKALLLRDACVGDAEDLPYTKFAIRALTSKKSSAFAIDGHTGAVNGHFGGPSTRQASPEGGWERKKAPC